MDGAEPKKTTTKIIRASDYGRSLADSDGEGTSRNVVHSPPYGEDMLPSFWGVIGHSVEVRASLFVSQLLNWMSVWRDHSQGQQSLS